MWAQRNRQRRTEQGAVAVIVAFSMTALLVGAGIVLDFGLARSDKLANKGYADAASAAGIRATDLGDGRPRSFRGVCTALAYLKANNAKELADLTASWRTGAGVSLLDPCTNPVLLNAACIPNDLSSWAWFTGTAAGGRISVEIKSGYTTPDPAFDASESVDNGVSAQGGCDQLAVIIEEKREPGLGRIASSDDIVTTVRSVARLMPSPDPPVPPALLLLERQSCFAVAVNSTNTKIKILGNGIAPGVIHADSIGNGVCTSGARVLYGKFAGGIVAHKAETGGLPGFISTSALSALNGAVPGNASDGASNVCAEQASGSCGQAIGRGLVGRGKIDQRYLVGVRAAISAAQTEYTRSPTNAAGTPPVGGGYTVIPASPSGCNNMVVSDTSQPAAYAASKVFVNCSGGVTFNNSTFPLATDVVFNGKVEVKSGQTLSLPIAERVYVKGASRSEGVSTQGNLFINHGVVAAGTENCANRTAAPRARLVIGNGALIGGAQSRFHLCNTTVLMAGNSGASALTGTPPTDGSTSTYCPLPTPPVVDIGIPPYANSCGGYISVGAGTNMDWSAPNLIAAGSAQTDWDQLEDLALWTETSAGNSMGGSGTLTVSGVFFLPNADPFIIGGGSSQSNGANAQFVARRLELNGSGVLLMRPKPEDAVTIPLPPSFGLVR